MATDVKATSLIFSFVLAHISTESVSQFQHLWSSILNVWCRLTSCHYMIRHKNFQKRQRETNARKDHYNKTECDKTLFYPNYHNCDHHISPPWRISSSVDSFWSSVDLLDWSFNFIPVLSPTVRCVMISGSKKVQKWWMMSFFKLSLLYFIGSVTFFKQKCNYLTAILYLIQSRNFQVLLFNVVLLAQLQFPDSLGTTALCKFSSFKVLDQFWLSKLSITGTDGNTLKLTM